MTVCIRLPALFADRIGGLSSVAVSARTIEGALRAMTERHPELRTLTLGPNGEVSPVMIVFLNNTQLAPDKFRAPVQAGDEIEIVPAIEGGVERSRRPWRR